MAENQRAAAQSITIVDIDEWICLDFGFFVCSAHSSTMKMRKLLSAIIADDPQAAKAMLNAHPALATALILKPRLHRSGIFHWIYARDTALHLAAAGYRVEIVQLLLESGADPNAAHNMRKSNPLHYAAD